MPLHLRWRAATTLPVELSGLTPDVCREGNLDELRRRRVRVGNQGVELAELFEVDGGPGDDRLILEGDLRTVRGIGQGMRGGSLRVEGAAGDRLGAELAGGTIEVEGSVGDWAGAEMRGGLLRIRGRAGNGLGAAFPGSRLGMREGMILVEGSAGDDAGLAMRRGTIAIVGEAGETAGRAMIAGSIFVFGQLGRRAGLTLRRGTIAVFGMPDYEVLPTFPASGRSRPPFLAIYLKRFRECGLPVPEDAFAGPVERYNGDLAEGGQGEILIGP